MPARTCCACLRRVIVDPHVRDNGVAEPLPHVRDVSLLVEPIVAAEVPDESVNAMARPEWMPSIALSPCSVGRLQVGDDVVSLLSIPEAGKVISVPGTTCCGLLGYPSSVDVPSQFRLQAGSGIVRSECGRNDDPPRRTGWDRLRRRRPRPGDKWHIDEAFIRIRGVQHDLWRAIDQDGVMLDILVQARRDANAAKRFLTFGFPP